MLIASMFVPFATAAEPLEPLPAVSLPSEIRGMRWVVRDDRRELVVLGAEQSWVVNPSSGAVQQRMAVGGVDVVTGDVDGDGSRELLLCGAGGILALRWEGERWSESPVQLWGQPCEAIEQMGTSPLTLGFVTVEGLQIATVSGGELTELDTVSLPDGGVALLASRGPLVAATRLGASTLVEWAPSGVSTIATGGAVGGLVDGPLGWTLPERGAVADITRRLLPVGPHPGRVQVAQLESEGAAHLIVARSGAIRLIQGGVSREVTHPAMGPGDHLSGADVDGDGCMDIVRASRETAQVQLLRSTACDEEPASAPLIPVRPGSSEGIRYTPAPDPLAGLGDSNHSEQPASLPYRSSPRALGMSLPAFTGPGPLTAEERMSRQRYVLLGTGWVVGGYLDRPLLRIPVFPALSVELEGGGPRARWFIGGDTAGLFMWIVDRGNEDAPDVRGGIHLANFTAGATFGSPRLRAGPFVTAGIWNVGAGVRAVATPWKESRFEHRGVEVRLTYFAPSVGEVMVMHVWSEPVRKLTGLASDHKHRRVPDFYAQRGHPRGFGACQRINIGLGAVVGGSSTQSSWQYVGSGLPVEVRGSPALAVSCDTGEKGTGLMLSVESAPVFSYLIRADRRRFHLGSASAGWMFGGRSWRAGPIATAGIWALSGGLRGTTDLFTDKQGLHHRLEVRAQTLFLASPAVETWLLYAISFDPRG